MQPSEKVDRLDLSDLTVRELLGPWSGSLRELRAHGIVRTYNSHIGSIAEEIVKLAVGGERQR